MPCNVPPLLQRWRDRCGNPYEHLEDFQIQSRELCLAVLVIRLSYDGHMPSAIHVYFHSPCFDGIVSALLISDFAQAALDYRSVKYHAVGYSARGRWRTKELPQHSAVVDFLYHPDASIWFDHHETMFVRAQDSRRFAEVRKQFRVYDPRASSCAALIEKHLRTKHSFPTSKYRRLVEWADRIDSAAYRRVADAIGARSAALQINRSLAFDDDLQYCEWLVEALRRCPLATVAQLPRVQRRFRAVTRRMELGLEAFKNSARLEHGGIVVFDVDAETGVVNRYAPYYFFPNARYSVGVMRAGDRAKVTAMRNPWKHFAGVPIGPLLARFGGGGHRRVGSVVLEGSKTAAAPAIVREVVSALK